MESHKLMRRLIRSGSVHEASEYTGLSYSLLTKERRKSGNGVADTGTRNSIDRMDLLCEFALDDDPEAVKLVGERYLTMYQDYVDPMPDDLEISDLLMIMGEAANACADAIACAGSLRDPSEAVTRAKRRLDHLLSAVKFYLRSKRETRHG